MTMDFYGLKMCGRCKSILEMFTAYFKYKIPFNFPFQHLKYVISLCKQLSWIVSTQFFPYNYFFPTQFYFFTFKNFVVIIQLDLSQTQNITYTK
jgi:hypothetical protein